MSNLKKNLGNHSIWQVNRNDVIVGSPPSKVIKIQTEVGLSKVLLLMLNVEQLKIEVVTEEIYKIRIW